MECLESAGTKDRNDRAHPYLIGLGFRWGDFSSHLLKVMLHVPNIACNWCVET